MPDRIDASDLAFDEAYAGPLRGLLELIDEIDPSILLETFSADDVTRWHMALGVIRQRVEQWAHLQAPRASGTPHLGRVPTLQDHPLTVIFKLLKKCPDDATPRALPRLVFIKDVALRQNIARDVDSLDRLLAQQEWKAATVIAGSLVEAFLLNGVEGHLAANGETPESYASAKGWFSSKRSPTPIPIAEWGLERLIQAGRDRGVIDAEDERPCRACQKYRNLIHPGQERISDPFDEGTALVAVGAVKRLLVKFA